MLSDLFEKHYVFVICGISCVRRKWIEENVMSLIKCPYCSLPISDRAVVCPKCGNSLVDLMVCPECGFKVLPGTKACPECGFPFAVAGPEDLLPERPIADEAGILPGGEIRDEAGILSGSDIRDEEDLLPERPIADDDEILPGVRNNGAGSIMPEGRPDGGVTGSAKTDMKKILIIGIAVLSAVVIILGAVLLSRAIFGTKTKASSNAENTDSPKPAEEPQKEDIEEPEEEEETGEETGSGEGTDPENGEDEKKEPVSENKTVSEPDAKEPEKKPVSKDDASRVVYPKPKPGDSSKPVKVEPAEEYEYTPVNADRKLWNDYLGAKDLYQATVSDKLKAAEYKDFQLRQISLVDLDFDGSLEMIVHWSEGKSDYLEVYGYKKKGTSAQKADQIFTCAVDRVDARCCFDDRLRTCFCLIRNRNGFVYVVDGDKSRIYYRKRDDGTYTVNADFVSEVPGVYERALNTPSDWSPAGVHMLELSENEFKEVNDALIGNASSASCSFTSPYDTISANRIKKEPMKFVKTWDKTWDSALYQYERTL